MSDEAHFHLSGNSNFWYWATANPNKFYQHMASHHMVCNIILRNYQFTFLEDDNGNADTPYYKYYIRIVEEFSSPQIAEKPEMNADIWLQQDWVNSHSAR